jgi:hypothetical protein
VHVLTDCRTASASPGGGVGTILCGSNTTTVDFARWILGDGGVQLRRAHRAPSNDPFE